MKRQLLTLLFLVLFSNVYAQISENNAASENVKKRNKTFCYMNTTVGNLLSTDSEQELRYGGAMGIGNTIGWQLGLNVTAMGHYMEITGQMSFPISIGKVVALGPKLGAGMLAGKVDSIFSTNSGYPSYTVISELPRSSYQNLFGLAFGISFIANIGEGLYAKIEYDKYLCPNYEKFNHDIISGSIGFKLILF